MEELKSICTCFSELVGDWITPEDVLTRQAAYRLLREFGEAELVCIAQDNETGLGSRFEYLVFHEDILLFATEENDEGKRSIGYMPV